MLTLAGRTIDSLDEFVSEVKTAHKKVNNLDALDFYGAMSRVLKECESYRELGTKEGASAAVAALSGVKNLHLVDIDMSLFRQREALFKDFNLTIDEQDSLKYKTADLSEVDFLLIDSLHNAEHTKKELNVHAAKVKKYILAHDTNSIPSIHQVMMEFVSKNSEWELVEYHQVGVGYTLLKRK